MSTLEPPAEAAGAPADQATPREAPRFYGIDNRAVTLAEYRYGTPLVLMPVALVVKALRIRLPGSTDDANVESLSPFAVDAFPPGVEAGLRPLDDGVAALGFEPVERYAIDDVAGQTRRHLTLYRHPTGRAIARVQQRIWHGASPAKTHRYAEFITGFADGRFLWTTSAKPDLLPPPACEVIRRKGAPPAELWAEHEAALAARAAASPVARVAADADAIDISEAHHATIRDFHLARGVFTDDAPPPGTPATHPVADFDDAMVIEEIRRLQNKRASWAGAAVLLGVSLLLFLALGFAVWSWEFVAMAVAILFFHELGHYVAMRLFGYRDVRMFFIPLFGAAVSGRAYHVAGWKQAVVALAGPLPGILVGAALGIAGLVREEEWLTTLGLLALVINGFNLLPFLPLDGGRVMQAILFSRHHWLDTAFRASAVLAILFIWLLTADRWMMGLAIVMAVSLPISFIVSQTTHQLRAAGVQAPPTDDGAIPRDLAAAILQRIRRGKLISHTVKAHAQHSLMVFEALTARPPGWLASLGLLTVHGGALLAAILFAAGIAFVQHFDVGGFVTTAAATAHYEPVPAAERRVARAAPADPPAADRITLLAEFPDGASAAFDALATTLPAGAAMHQFGRSLLVTLPADEALRAEWVDRLQALTPSVSVHAEPFGLSIALVAIAPTDQAAADIEAELSEAAAARSPVTIPPWATDADWPPADRQRHRAARKTLLRLQQAEQAAYGDDAELHRLRDDMAEASRVGDRSRAEALEAEWDARSNQLVEDAIAAVRADPAADAAVVDRYTALRALQFSEDEADWQAYDARFRAELVPLLGAFDAEDDPRAANALASGFTSRSDLLVHVHNAAFNDPGAGAAALVAWLEARGCSDIRYDWLTYGFGGFPDGFLEDPDAAD